MPKSPHYSIVENVGMQENYKCGYCHSKDTNVSYGIWAHLMTVSDYQALINRGWRRSGKYCYKPQLDKMCCPTYTIRCEPLNFKPTKSHKKVLKRLQHFLINGENESKLSKDPDHRLARFGPDLNSLPSCPRESSELRCSELNLKAQDVPSEAVREPPPKLVKPGVGADPNRPTCLKKKLMKADKKKHASENKVKPHDIQGNVKRLEDYIQLKPERGKHFLQLKVIRTDRANEQFNLHLNESFEVYRKYQTVIHEDPPNDTKLKQYVRFLVDSPLIPQELGCDILEDDDAQFIPIPSTYGNYHCQYWLDGIKLIAVGVLDILPECISSKYFYYDPDYNHLSLGVVSALCEIAMVRKLSTLKPDLKYYYMGYYIHSCPKMRYKSQYRPSFLLCPERFTWVPFELCLPKLDEHLYTALHLDDSPLVRDEDIDVDSVLIYYGDKIVTFANYLSRGRIRTDAKGYSSAPNPNIKDLRDEVLLYAKMTGPDLCRTSIVLYRH